ncbi:MAG: diguanylate cyclase [Candidatus Accumulibacter sp.]|jgi:diguanylate cyclase (GGDEF)-like protein|nr:diguanylate cyclase [Accumulibacter sp.]
MQVEVGFSDIPNSATAGRQVAEQAVRASGRQDPCDMALLFCTARHDQRSLREAVASVIGSSARIYGGGAVGIITNKTFGYAGDQVGIACMWLDGSRCDALTDHGLLESEQDAGVRLGQGLARLGATPESPVVLFYDAVGCNTGGDIRLLMATWILAGLEKGLGFLPDIVGAGLQADHICSPASQYIGEEMKDHCAMALKFSDDLRIDSAIMHGCRPASQYYTVTRAEGPVILEINGKPALEFMDGLLGPGVTPEEYPFFLLFGINHGARWGKYDENDYASRLCLGIDKKRNGIVMFEPDMVEGTKFQLMFRSLNLDYMKPKIEALFDRLEGREPVFAMYIDCAGRCAGYGGMDIEDAVPLQQAIAGRVPLLGFYTGVEVASIGGRPRGLDWTGVLCLFSRNRESGKEKTRERAPVWDSAAARSESDGIPLEAALKIGERNAAHALMLDMQTIKVRHELEIKRRGFRLLAELAVSLRRVANYGHILSKVSQRINAALNMQKTVALLPDDQGRFMPAVLRGFTLEEEARLAGQCIPLAPEFLDPEHPILVTAADAPERFAVLRQSLGLPCFIASPIILQNEIAAVLLTGRMVEQPPYLGRLGKNDVETVQAVSELLGSVLIRQRLENATLRAESDPLTGLWNRTTFRQKVERYLSESSGDERIGAFLMLDVDYFKSINDRYGHAAGDDVLLACAAAMRGALRDSDIIGRHGGDEFAVFCKGANADSAKNKARQIGEAWKNIALKGGERPVTSSIGIALAPRDGKNFQELFNNADMALYKAKERGRNCHVLFGEW